MIKIFDNLYHLNDGRYLRWNWFTRSWKITFGGADIFEQELPDVDFEEIKRKYTKNID